MAGRDRSPILSAFRFGSGRAGTKSCDGRSLHARKLQKSKGRKPQTAERERESALSNGRVPLDGPLRWTRSGGRAVLCAAVLGVPASSHSLFLRPGGKGGHHEGPVVRRLRRREERGAGRGRAVGGEGDGEEGL